MLSARIVETLAIRDQDCEHRAELEQLVPVAIVAGEPRSVEADHKAGITEANLSDQLLETVALHAPRARFAEILVDDLHTLMGPSQSDGAVDEPVLQLRAFLVLLHLV